MRRTMLIKTAMCAVIVMLASSVVPGQEPPASQAAAKPAAPAKIIIPLKIRVTIGRYEGEKKTQNLPFMLMVNANAEQTVMNLGARVGVPNAPGLETVNVGTNLSLSATTIEDGRFKVSLTVSDTSLQPGKDSTGPRVPAVQSFTTVNHLLMRDGQTLQFIAATDKVTGEVTKVDVTLNVLK